MLTLDEKLDVLEAHKKECKAILFKQHQELAMAKVTGVASPEQLRKLDEVRFLLDVYFNAEAGHTLEELLVDD